MAIGLLRHFGTAKKISAIVLKFCMPQQLDKSIPNLVDIHDETMQLWIIVFITIFSFLLDLLDSYEKL